MKTFLYKDKVMITKISTRSLKDDLNRKNIYNLLLEDDQLSILDISRHLKISQPTVSKNIDYLISQDLVYNSGSLTNTGGRNANIYSPVLDAKLAIGLDINATHISLVIINIGAEIKYKDKLVINFERNDHYYKEIADFVDKSILNSKIDVNRILGVVIGLPALIDFEKQIVTYGSVLKIQDLTAKEISKYIRYKTFIVHDSKAAAFAETWKSKDNKYAFYIMLNNSIGGGLIIDNEVIQGHHSRSAEIGHVIVEEGGRECYCGQKGCFEPYCSATNLSDYTGGDLNRFFELLKEEDPGAKKIRDQYISYLAKGIHSINMLFDSTIILGGFVGKYIDDYIEDIREILRKMDPFNEDLENIKACKFKDDPLAVGAALFLIDDFIKAV